MATKEFKYIRESITLYQQSSQRFFTRLGNTIPDLLEIAAKKVEIQPYPGCQRLASKARCVKEISRDITEALELSNDLVCDKLVSIVEKVER